MNLTQKKKQIFRFRHSYSASDMPFAFFDYYKYTIQEVAQGQYWASRAPPLNNSNYQYGRC